MAQSRQSYWERHPAMRRLAERLLRRSGMSYEDVRAAIEMQCPEFPVPSRSQVYRLKRGLGLVQSKDEGGRMKAERREAPLGPPVNGGRQSVGSVPASLPGENTGTEAGATRADADHIPDVRQMVEPETVIRAEHVLAALAGVPVPDSGATEIPPNPPLPKGGTGQEGNQRLPSAVEAMCSYELLTDCRLPGLVHQSMFGCVSRQLQHRIRRFTGGVGQRQRLNERYYRCRECPHWLSDRDYAEARRYLRENRMIALKPPWGRCGPSQRSITTSVPAQQ